ncbi:uncharacterized protein J4E92_005525 [Alternaria infectoria]|uniref:uncharacterized protein n=1 Tax=Alternaria infectoria TaxID=45303 RepID=UPI00221F4506|nr:uncharacterized protein J4E92_005525 [Alternaria infectoria]KAI4928043.1 hypothetical protein J4E92_005525 [Alternaria infectoria]
MPNCKPTEPETADCYFDLGVTQYATATDIKAAYRILALQHHPDKKAPGRTIDAVEFRRVNEAFEILRYPEKRNEYDALYEGIQEEWAEYRCAYAKHELQEEIDRIDAEKEEARVQREQRRQEEERRRKAEEKARIEAERIARERKEKLAEERSRQAAERAEKERARAAEEWLRKWEEEEETRQRQRREQRQKEAEAREAIVREQHRLEQERKAQEYLAALEAQQKLAEQKVRQAEELMVRTYMEPHFANTADPEAQRIQRRVRLAHMWARKLHVDAKAADDAAPDAKFELVDLGWHRIDGTATCDFCVKDVRLYFFACPLGGAAACGDCVYKFAHGYETANGEVIGKRKVEERKADKVGGKKGKTKGKGKGKN